MNGLGYVPACSSSSISKTCRKSRLRYYCALFWYCEGILPISLEWTGIDCQDLISLIRMECKSMKKCEIPQ